LNIAVHIAAGTCAMALGLFLLGAAKGSPGHRRWGRRFVTLTLVVCATGAIGNIFFRFTPVFAVLTVLVLYQLLSGWHVIYTKANGPNRVDLMLLICAIAATLLLGPVLFGTPGGPTAKSVVYASFSGLLVLLSYDAVRWLFPRRWHATLWPYEHIYKLIASLFAMLSAASGNTLKFGQPWTQLGPSVAGAVAILWFCWRQSRAPVSSQEAGLAAVNQHPAALVMSEDTLTDGFPVK
jgi:uncharacterized membrane protein